MPAATRSGAAAAKRPRRPRPRCRPRGGSASHRPASERGPRCGERSGSPACSAARLTSSAQPPPSPDSGKRRADSAARSVAGARPPSANAGAARSKAGPAPGMSAASGTTPAVSASEARQATSRSRTSAATRARPSRRRTWRDMPASQRFPEGVGPAHEDGSLLARESLEPRSRIRRNAGIGKEELVRRARVPQQCPEAFLENGQIVVRENDDVHGLPSSGRKRGRGSERVRSPGT